MAITRLGYHVKTGPRNGYGVAAAAGPAVVRIVDEFGALDELPDGTGAILRTVRLYKDGPHGLDQATPEQAAAMGRDYAPRLYDIFKNPIDRHGQRLALYVEPTNEIGGGGHSEGERVAIRAAIAYEGAVAAWLNARGIKVAHFGLAGDSPILPVWREYYLPFLALTAANGNIYARNAYGGQHPEAPPSGLLTDQQGQAVDPNARRPLVEAAELAGADAFIPIVISELGQAGGYGYPVLDDYIRYDALIAPVPMIWGACIWTYGDGWGQSNLQQISGALAGYIRDRDPAPLPVRPPDPPDDGADARVPYRRKYYLMPPGATADQVGDLVRQVWDSERPTIGGSADDAGIGRGLTERRVVVIDPDRWGDDPPISAWFNTHYPGVVVEERRPPAPDPRVGLVLGRVLDAPAVYTSVMDDPRPYGKHEGVDLAPIGDTPQVDSKAHVLAAYGGRVDRVATSADGYGLYIRIASTNNGAPFYLYYAHLDAAFVTEGLGIVKGSAIGEVGDTGNATGEHLHLTFRVPNYGRSGYVVPDVVDPRPYLPDPGQVPPPTGAAGIGIHASATPDIRQTELDMIRSIRPDVIKVLSFHSGAAIARLRADNPAATFIVRAFLSMRGRQITPAQFLVDTLPDVKRALDALGSASVWVEIHNEPNLIDEGLGTSWQDGRGFAAWFIDVLTRYRAALPGVRFLYPGLSPGGDVAGVRIAHRPFMDSGRDAIARADALAVHVYWSGGFPMVGHPDAGLTLLDDYIARHPGRDIWITEASHNGKGTAPGDKGAQYLSFWREVRRRRPVRGVTYFVASAAPGTFDHEVWLDGAGRSRGIAEIVAAR